MSILFVQSDWIRGIFLLEKQNLAYRGEVLRKTKRLLALLCFLGKQRWGGKGATDRWVMFGRRGGEKIDRENKRVRESRNF